MDSRPNSQVPDKREPSTTQASFMFVDTQNDLSQEFGVGREKMAFLSKLAHRRRKKESIQRLKTSQRANNQQLTTSEDLVMQGATRQGAWTLNGYLGQGYVDPFDTSSVAMTDSMNLYFHHCVFIPDHRRGRYHANHLYSSGPGSANGDSL
jgi:hypothetical protein